MQPAAAAKDKGAINEGLKLNVIDLSVCPDVSDSDHAKQSKVRFLAHGGHSCVAQHRTERALLTLSLPDAPMTGVGHRCHKLGLHRTGKTRVKRQFAVDELPPVPLDDLIQESQQKAETSAHKLHPDQLPPLSDFQNILQDEGTSPYLPQDDMLDHLDPPSVDLIETAREGVVDDHEALKHHPAPTGGTLFPDFSLDGPPPPQEIDLLAVQQSSDDLPPPPLMPPVDLPPKGQDDIRTDADRLKPAPKLLDRDERSGYMRAVNLFHKLHHVGNEGRQETINRLFEIVLTFPHSASIRAIEELFDTGCDLQEIEDAVALKEYWRSDSSLWMRRYLGTLELHSDSRHQTHLSWAAAHALSFAMGRERALDALKGILLQEWLTMKRDPYSGSAFELCFYHHFVLKRAQEIREGSMDPILQVYEGNIHDDPVMPTYIQVRNTAPNFTGRPTEKVFLPNMQNIDQISSTFSRQTKKEQKIAQEVKGATDAG